MDDSRNVRVRFIEPAGKLPKRKDKPCLDYINRRRKTNGHLFQGRYKAVVLKKDRSLGK
jgi:hypothetical protein